MRQNKFLNVNQTSFALKGNIRYYRNLVSLKINVSFNFRDDAPRFDDGLTDDSISFG